MKKLLLNNTLPVGMKKERIRLGLKVPFFLFIQLVLFSFTALSQSGSVTISQIVPTTVSVCDSAQFMITVKNNTSGVLSGLLLNAAMPGGVNYIPGSVHSLPAGVSQSNISNLQNPVFLIPNIPAFNSISILFYAKVDCGIIAYQQQGNPIINTATVTYTNSTTDQNVSTTYNVNAPSLVITSFTNQSHTGAVGSTFTRSITITNSGTGSLSSFTFTDAHGGQINIISAVPGIFSGTSTNDTVFVSGADFTAVGNHNTQFDNGESITIIETVRIEACIQPGIPSNIKVFWGCGNQAACQTAVTTANVTEIPVGTPDLVITPSESFETCLDPAVARRQSLKIINVGAGSANHISIDIYQGAFMVPNSTYQTRIDETSFTFQYGINGSPTAITSDSALNNSTFPCFGPNPKYRVYLRIPAVINPLTDTLYLKWNSYSCCPAACSSFNTVAAPWEFKGQYTDACDSTVKYDIFPTSGGSIYGRYFNASMTPENVPTDLSNGITTFEYSVTNWQNDVNSAPGAYYQAAITIPRCFTLASTAHPIRFINNSNGSIWNPTSAITISGNIATAVFTAPDPFGVDGLTNASLLFDLNADCSTCHDSGWARSISVDVRYNPNPSCSNSCSIGLYCSTTSVNLHCGGACTGGGLGFLSYKMERTSYGQPDNNNDGLPEGGSVNLALIKNHRAMFNDTLTGYFKGVIHSAPGHLTFPNAYASDSINNLGQYISFIDAKVTIYDASTAITYSCNNVLPLSAAPSGSTYYSNFDLSPAYLNAHGCTIPAGFVFENGDSILLNHRYKVIANTGGPIISSNSTTDFYASDIPNPNPNAIPANKFSCDNYSGNYVSLYGYYFTSDTVGFYSVKSCSTATVKNTDYLSIGPCCQNYGHNKFPFEYRPWARIDTIKVIKPAGYDYVSATIEGLGQISQSIAPSNPNSNTLLFYVGALYTSNTWPNYSFDGYANTIKVTLAPNCMAPNSTIEQVAYEETHKKFTYLNGGDTTVSIISDHIVSSTPQIIMQSALQTVDGINSIESWDLKLCNISNNSDAFNTWLGFVSPSGNLSVVDVMNLATSALIVPVGGIYQLGTRAFDSCATYRIRFKYHSCALDSIVVNAGWNCSGYPDSLASYHCTPKKYDLYVNPKPSALQMQVAGPARDTIALCDTVSYEIILNSVLSASCYNLHLTASLPSGMTIEPGSSEFRYPVNGAWAALGNPTANVWDLSALIPQIDTFGLKGVNFPNLSQLKIRFKIRPDCNFICGSTVPFSAASTNICGQSHPPQNATSGPLYIRGVEHLNITSMRVVMDSIHQCGMPSLVRVTVVNIGPNATSGNEHFYFPSSNDSVVSGSFTGIHNTPLSAYFNNILNGQHYFDWTLPPGVQPLDSVVFTFNIIVNPDSINCSNIIFPVKTIGSFNATCIADNSVCIIRSITSAASLSIPVNHPCPVVIILTAVPASPTLCSGDSTLIALTSNVPGTIFSWTVNQTGVTGGSSGSGSSIIQTLRTIGNVPGTAVYTITPSSNGCHGAPVIITITVNPSDSSAAFTYTSGTYCTSGTSQTPAITGLPGGIFTAVPGGLSINSSTGIINLSTSALGIYTVTYTTPGICPKTSFVSITITNVTPSAVFSYPASPYCPNGNNPFPVFGSGASAGTFTVTPAGLVFVNANTGQIDLALSAIGIYTVVNTIPASGSCLAATATATVSIARDNASFVYTSATYCQSGANPTPAITGLPGGIFSAAPAGLVINPSTGTIDLATSILGTYTLSYTTNGSCPNTSSIVMTIDNTTPSAAFSYSALSYCQNGIDPSPIFVSGSSAGIFSAVPAGLIFVHVNTGQIDLTASTPGTYTVTNTIPVSGSCSAVIATTIITITPLDNASFTYSSGTYCTSGTNPAPLITGLPGGVFSAAPAGLSINPLTGIINLAASALGTYTLSYTTNGACSNTSSITMTIGSTTPSAAFSYSAVSFCQNSGNPFPIFASGASAGTFTVTPAGLVFVNANTGQIDLALSATGTYTIVNTIPASGSCLSATASTTVTIARDNASFVYTSATYCQSGADPTPTVTGLQGGTFSASPAGLSINPSTGTINLAASTVGAYTLSYTTNGSCPNTSSIVMTIDNTAPSAAFSYSGLSYCQNGIDPSPIFVSGSSAGIFSAAPAGLIFVHVNTGQIDLSASAPGTYTVTNTIPVSGSCSAVSATAIITISPLDNASFTFSSGTYCTSGTNPTPVITGLPGGVFSSVPAGLSINTSTGTINLAASALGTYTLSYTTNGLCSNTSSITMTIGSTTPSAAFSYSGLTFCQNGSSPFPIFAPGASAGAFTVTPSGLIFENPATGEINLALSAMGTYSVVNTIPASGSCLAATAATIVTITLDDASFTYTSATYCQSGTNPTPIITGLAGGTFSCSPAGLSINPATGIINLAASVLGSYTLSYTTNGNCPNTSSITMTIDNTTPAATFHYSNSSYCPNGTDPLPVYTSGSSAGIFSASPAGLVFVHVNTGQIDLSASAPGTYTVTNTIPVSGSCLSAIATTTVVISVLDNASFTYSSGTYCQSGANQTPVITGVSGGTFSSVPSGLSINSSTGMITLSTSALGVYTVNYTTSGACSNTNSITITIGNTTPPADFSYSAASFCQSGNNPFPIYAAGASAGIFSAVPAGLVFVNLNTGGINLSLSAAGTYTVTNTIPTSGLCLAVSAVTTITITADDASFTYGSGFYCQSGTNPLPVITGLPGGVFSAAPSGLIINSATGLINLAGSTLGTYILTYTTNGACPNSSHISLTIGNTTPSAIFSYSNSSFCQNGTNPFPMPGANFGSFSAVPAGLVFVNPNTGEINLSLSLPGTYTVTNTIPASGNCLSASASITVVILPADDASFVYSSATYCQSGADPTAAITGLQGGVFTASPAGLSINSSTGAINLASSLLNIYTLSYTTNGACPKTSSITMTITNTNPSATFSYAGSPFCQLGNNPFPIYTGGSSAGIFTASPAGLVFVHVNTGQINLALSAPGTYTVTNTIPVSGTCLSAAATTIITISPAPIATAAAVSQNICSGSSASITLTSTIAGTIYTWTVSQTGVTGGSGGTGTGISQVLTLIGSNQGTAIYTVVPAAGGCIGAPAIVPITINPLPVSDTASVIIKSANCNDTTGFIKGIAVTSGFSPLHYIWKDSAGNIAGDSLNLINAAPGRYTLTITDGNGCSSTAGAFTIHSTALITAAFTVNPTTGETPLTVNFTNNSINASHYLWQFGTGDTSTSVNPTYVYVPLGNFTVCLRADNGGLCADTACSTIDIYINSVFAIPNVFSPNGDGVNDIFTVQSKGLRTLEAEIYNRWGEKLYEWHTTNGGWDGRSASGVLCTDGTYYFIINAMGIDGKKYFEKGAFSLVH